MILKFKIFKKVISLVLVVLLFTNPLVVPLVYAEGEGTDPTPTPTETSIVSPAPSDPSPSPAEQQRQTQSESEPTPTQVAPTDTPEVTPTDVPQSTITTGDAGASSQTDTTVNSNQNTVDGSLATPTGSCSTPEGQTNCPGDIGIGNSNQATVSGSTDSSANTGENKESGSGGDASIDTGDATASGQITNDINTNIVALEATTSPTLSLTPSPETTPSPESVEGQPSNSSPETKDLTVNNENNGKVTNNADISAKTGENVASENLGNADLKTGDALAWVNLLNLLNTNIVGSDFEFLFFDIKDDSNGEINLNEIWKQLQASNGSNSIQLVGDQTSSSLRLVISNKNIADLENKLKVCAFTGNNQADQNNSVEIDTGDATALANITNIVNTNILGTKFFFGIINITGQFKGNLILPRPENFLGGSNPGVGGAGVNFENQNSANVSDNLSTTANTGENQSTNNSGNNSINTGDSKAYSSDFSIINLNLFSNDWFYLLINALGSWNGSTYGWSNPEAVDGQTGQNQTYQTGSNEEQNSGGLLTDDFVQAPENSLSFQNQNSASVKNGIEVTASTGGNAVDGNKNGTSIKTGNAKAILNLINLINLNILASRWFLGLINVLGNWSGNAIFAYPDLVVDLSGSPDEVYPGDSFEYNLNFNNQGYDDAEEVVVKMEFPKGLIYEGDSSGIQANCASQNCSWSIGDLKRSQSGSFKVKVKLDSNFLSLNDISFWEKLIPKVYAAESAGSFTVKASVTTVLPESNNDNNSSVRTTNVVLPAVGGGETTSADTVDQRQPVLEIISAKNNVNDFVYPGDTVTFEIKVKNTGEVRSEETYLTHGLYDGVSDDFGIAKIKIGTIEPGRTAKVTFGMTIVNKEDFHAGSYHTETQAFGIAPNGNNVSSNVARTDFNLRLKNISELFEAKAIENKEEEVLGVSTEACPVPKNDLLPYVLLFALSSLWIVDRSRRFSKRYLLEK